jgi:hypothetical protein
MAGMRTVIAAVLLAGCGGATTRPRSDAAAMAPGTTPDAAPDLPARPSNPGCHAPAHPVPAGLEGLPLHLSDTGCFERADPTRPVAALIPYTVRSPLWSDGADKDRWLALPDGDRIHVEADGDFTLPPGAVLIKTFRVDMRPVETRFFVRHEGGEWSGYTYEWNEAGADATLLDEGSHRKIVGLREWHFPSRAECDNCHTPAAGHALGLELAQLDRDQRRRLAALDLFAGPLPDVPVLNDASTEAGRARATRAPPTSGSPQRCSPPAPATSNLARARWAWAPTTRSSPPGSPTSRWWWCACASSPRGACRPWPR